MPSAGSTITILSTGLDGGINDVFEWEVSRRKNGGSWAVIGTYNLINEGHYTAPDSGTEYATGTFSFSYETDIPGDAVNGDTYEYRFEGNDAWLGDDEIVRVTGEYTVTDASSVVISSSNIFVGIMVSI